MDFFTPPHENKKLSGFEDLDKTLENEPFVFDRDKEELDNLENGTVAQNGDGSI